MLNVGDIYNSNDFGKLEILEFMYSRDDRTYYKVRFLKLDTINSCQEKYILNGTAKANIDKIINGIEMRYCRFCDEWKPRNNDYFAKNGKFFRTQCRLCRNKTDKKLKVIQYKTLNGITYQKCTECGKWLESNTDNFSLINEKGLKSDGNLQTRGWCNYCLNKNNNKNWRIKREREEQLPSTLTQTQWKETLKYFNYCCAYCGKTEEQNKSETITKKRPNGFRLGHDHITPVIEGGEYSKDNIIPCCTSCNSKKGIKSFYEWYPSSDIFDKEKFNNIIKFINTYKIKNSKLNLRTINF